MHRAGLRGLLVAAAATGLLAGGSLEAKDSAEKAAARRARAMLAQTEGLAVFLGTIEDARKEALDRNVPLLVHLMVDTEVCSTAYLSNVIGDTTLASMSERAIVVIGSDGDHGQVRLTDKVNGKPVSRMVCPTLPWFENCAAHATSRDNSWIAYKDADGEMRAPQTIIELAEGGISFRHDTTVCPPVGPIIGALGEAQETSGHGMTAREHAEVLVRRERGLKALKAGDWGAAFGDLWRARKLAQNGTLARLVAEELAIAADEIEQLIGDWSPKLVAGTEVEAFEKLAGLEPHIAGTKWEKSVGKSLDEAERDQSLTPLLAGPILAREAEKLWSAYEAAVTATKDRKATSTLRKLLDKKYAETPAGTRAAEANPDLARKVRR